MNQNFENLALLERPPLESNSETLNVPKNLAELSTDYVGTLINGQEGTPEELDSLDIVKSLAITTYLDPEHKDWGGSNRLKIPLTAQLDYVARLRTLLGEQATFGLKPLDLSNDEQNLTWLETIAQGDWPIAVGGSFEDHDRSAHLDSFVYAPPEQAMLMTMAAEYALKARKAGQDITIPAHYGGSTRGVNFDKNLLGLLDHSTDGLGLSRQTKDLLEPLLEPTADFGELIKENTPELLEEIEMFLKSPAHDIGRIVKAGVITTSLSLALGCLETITLATQGRDVSPDEIKIALYEVIKGYVRTAAKLRGKAVPDGALDFWPTDEHGAPMTKTMEELLFELDGSDRQVIDPRL